jgi:glycosyltransferase involved in cell wall biosynthesis
MRIAIDARMMGPGNTRGIGRYTEEIVRAMLDVAPQHTYILLEKDPDRSPFLLSNIRSDADDSNRQIPVIPSEAAEGGRAEGRDHPSVEHLKADVPWYGLAEQILMPGIIRQAKADILFAPHWNVTWSCPVPRVVFIHDLILLEEPLSANITTRGPFVARIKRLGFRLILRRALHSSARILVPLEYTKEWIRKHFPDLKTPVIVTGEGMPDLDQSAWSEPDLDHPYFLTVGSAYPHKNLETLFRAWATISERHPDVRLVVAGKKDAFMERMMGVSGFGFRDSGNFAPSPRNPNPESRNPNVSFLGEVSDADLKRLYVRALALIFPSRLEGFGLPPLEAIAAGCPVLSSDASCMPETLGPDGAIFFHPDDSDGMIRAIETVISDPASVRERARRAAPVLKQRHDWRRAAERTLRVFGEVGSRL